MKIYFTASTTNLERDRNTFLKVLSIIEDLGHEVLDSWLVEKLLGKENNQTSREILLKNINLVEESDFAIVELSTPSLGVGYFIGQTIASHKKLLALYPDTMLVETLSEIVTGSTSSYLSLNQYNQDNLETIIRDYVASFSMEELRKFNFVANEQILDFIDKGSIQEGKSKSEFLRDKILTELMK